MTRKQMRAACSKQKLKLIFDKVWNMVKAVRPDGTIAFDGPEYDLVERLNAGELL